MEKLNDSINKHRTQERLGSKTVKEVVVCFDKGSGDEAIYIDGVIHDCFTNVFVNDIVAAINDPKQPILFSQFMVKDLESNVWPESLEVLRATGNVVTS